jgi:predicted kinase
VREGQVRLVLVGGAPRTGKSTLAGSLAARIGAVVIRSDEVRKELAGLDPLTPAPAAPWEGLYQPWTTAGAYAELLRRAAIQLGLGQTVVLDATWRDPAWRAGASSVARDASAELVELRCCTPLDVALDRARRGDARADPSDATQDVVRALWSQHVPWPSALAVDTSGEPGDALAVALARIRGTTPREAPAAPADGKTGTR